MEQAVGPQAPPVEAPAAPSAIDRPQWLASRLAMPLALAVTLLLFAQWPLREGLGRWSVQINDAAQVLFALYVAVALSHASWRGATLVARPDLHARRGRWRTLGAALASGAWAGAVLLVSAPAIARSAAQWERFPESDTPGYFLLKVALGLLAVLVLLRACAEAAGAWRRPVDPAR